MPSTSASATSRSRHRHAFTLIEVLVVVAILALLVAVLLPSLKRARDQAKLATDRANMKQIATAISMYQSEYAGYVPIMENYWSAFSGRSARLSLLSVALRRYDAGTAKLKHVQNGRFDPEAVWSKPLVDEYEDTLMPRYYSCPFERDHGTGLDLVSEDTFFRYYEWRGRFESYHTWMWQDVAVGKAPGGKYWPGGGPHPRAGFPRYSVLTWNRRHEKNVKGLTTTAHRQWTSRAAQAVGAGSLSEVTTVFCAQGEHMQWVDNSPKLGRANIGSHPGSRGGGTLAIFGDTHVDWVIGTQIGWP